ncbi:NACHT and WD repeat domain-containing protein 2-like [Ruditapes philippinarum]|uniref:NACHT and WD repeat domain-containing protein 2-like n=1 Tax=Ruditapes philippinarum TaxID=129788 RepID=UPI00295C1E99|nr:NACHT and WD repeat domain-containing protein 2-like [Ruditapes philippinarum]
MEEPGAGEMSGILDGSADEVSSSASRIIRVFLSSTFSDMAEERNMLLQDVYPKISEYAKNKYGVNFQMVDMRWGVTNEAQNDHMTSECCLREIKNCQNVSIGPNFVGRKCASCV